MFAHSDKGVILALKNFLFSCVPRVLHQVLNGRKSVAIVVKVKKSKVFRQEGFTFAIFRLLHTDYQLFTQGETPSKNNLVFIEGFTLLYCLIINQLYL